MAGAARPRPRARGGLPPGEQVAHQPRPRAGRARRRPVRRTTCPTVARHRADGRGAVRARCPHRHHRRRLAGGARADARGRVGRLRPGRHGDPLRPAGGRARRRTGRLRRRSSHAYPADGRDPARAAHARRPRRGRRAPVHGPRRRSGTGWQGRAGRVGVEPVRVRTAAGGGSLRPRGRRGPRRQAGAVAAPHRHDRGHAAHPRGRRGRRRAEPLARRARAGPRGRPRDRARPVQRRTVPRPRRDHPRVGHRARLATLDHAGRRRAPRPPDPDGLPGRARRPGPLRARDRPPRGAGRRPPRRRGADPGHRRALRPGRGTVVPPRDRAHPRPRDRSAVGAGDRAEAAWAPTSPSEPTASSCGRRRCTAGCSTPTPTTGWPTPARCSARWSRAS